MAEPLDPQPEGKEVEEVSTLAAIVEQVVTLVIAIAMTIDLVLYV